MLTHPTLDQMQALGLGGMAAAYRDLADQSNADDRSRDDWLGLMLGREAAIRADKRLTNRLRLRTSGRPARPFRALPAHAASVRGSRSGASRWPLSPSHRPTGSGATAHPATIALTSRAKDATGTPSRFGA